VKSVPAESEVPEASSRPAPFFDEPRICQELTDLLEREGRLALRVRGSSMWPWVKSGAEAELVQTRPCALNPGDLALYRRGSTLALHRVVRRQGGAWQMRGDAYGSCIETVLDRDILARAEGLMIGRTRFTALPGAVERRAARAILRWGPACAWLASRAMGLRRRVFGIARS
jgi:hypothetical protein